MPWVLQGLYIYMNPFNRITSHPARRLVGTETPRRIECYRHNGHLEYLKLCCSFIATAVRNPPWERQCRSCFQIKNESDLHRLLGHDDGLVWRPGILWSKRSWENRLLCCFFKFLSFFYYARSCVLLTVILPNS